MLKITRQNKREAVYDITVLGNENFFANGILVHNCAEITLPTKPLKDLNDGAHRRKIRIPKNKYNEYLEYKKSVDGILRLDKEKFNGKKST
jgi:hypothetical protein